MATLTVHDLADGLVQALRNRAAEHGRTAEAEHREILREALAMTPAPSRHSVAATLAEFRHRTAARSSPSVVELLRESRDGS